MERHFASGAFECRNKYLVMNGEDSADGYSKNVERNEREHREG